MSLFPKRSGEGGLTQIFCKGDLRDRLDFATGITSSHQWTVLHEIVNGLGAKIELDKLASPFSLILPKEANRGSRFNLFRV